MAIGTTDNPAAPRKVMAAERQALALALRKQGGSYRKIAERMREDPRFSPEYSTATAYHDVMSALKKLNEHNTELAEEVRRLELERIDDLHATLWPKALKGDYAAFDRVVALMDRRARYLDLYKEKQVSPVDITVFIRQMATEYGLDPDEAVKEAERVVRASPR